MKHRRSRRKENSMDQNQNITYDDMSDMISGMMQSIVDDYGEETPEKTPESDPSKKDEDPKA